MASTTDARSGVKTFSACSSDLICSGAYVYFNHSYYCQVQNPSDVIATTEYGIHYGCAVWRENIFGVQFRSDLLWCICLFQSFVLLPGTESIRCNCND